MDTENLSTLMEKGLKGTGCKENKMDLELCIIQKIKKYLKGHGLMVLMMDLEPFMMMMGFIKEISNWELDKGKESFFIMMGEYLKGFGKMEKSPAGEANLIKIVLRYSKDSIKVI